MEELVKVAVVFTLGLVAFDYNKRMREPILSFLMIILMSVIFLVIVYY